MVLLVLLWGASALARRYLIGADASPFPSGGIVMAGGIFVIAALGKLPLPVLVVRLVVLELLVVWAFIAYSYVGSGLSGGLAEGLRQPANVFAVGTWVAGSAVLGRALVGELPGWEPVAFALWLVAAAVWLWYLSLLPAAFRDAVDPSDGYRATGAVLLPVVGTQSLVVAGDALLPGGMPRTVAVALILLGCLLYAFGLFLVGRRYGRSGWTLADDWDNTNCILHGATSITGLAIVLTGALPGTWAVATWVWILAAFVLVEAAEVLRAFFRTRAYGWRKGVLAYLPSQWSRNFTFGMFYAFSLQLQMSAIQMPLVAAGLLRIVVTYGHYVVLAFLLAETAVFLADRVRSGAAEPKG
ncbi:MAG: hypothetical protein AVDCRST_MAG22-2762 [uncultured Rubrobacteraceae bacterium]|uniref:C4-dicarboxylate transporter/malic acid transport protein n=1 Tax=uncultured Rubrobacteraceae bacterium TaxID=349277 RepID=A0A6J4PWE7_9ACTN|nr:MAG: hypothetical protein AVDCRST_MAG22-2762 [uncultured Rubrobacteraceae bacterium]